MIRRMIAIVFTISLLISGTGCGNYSHVSTEEVRSEKTKPVRGIVMPEYIVGVNQNSGDELLLNKLTVLYDEKNLTISGLSESGNEFVASLNDLRYVIVEATDFNGVLHRLLPPMEFVDEARTNHWKKLGKGYIRKGQTIDFESNVCQYNTERDTFVWTGANGKLVEVALNDVLEIRTAPGEVRKTFKQAMLITALCFVGFMIQLNSHNSDNIEIQPKTSDEQASEFRSD